jgi:hypothetical protein
MAQESQPGAAVPQETGPQKRIAAPKQPFRVLDMACGSGSFLLGAYQCLLDHCLKWYIDHKPATHKRAVYQDPRNGQWRLTIEQKKRILTTHLFGVDIDAQAVEVTKLSLLLKALEGEDDASLSRQLELFHSRALPNLADNIQCGNSLIGPDYFTGQLIPDPDEMKRVNAFDWKEAFPEAMRAGGFDSVIGNPPYIRIQTMKEWAPLEVEIYKQLYESAKSGNYDIYVVFVEQSFKLLNPGGQLGLILPSKFFATDYGTALRGIIGQARALRKVVDFGHAQVFGGASNYTCLLFLSRLPVSAGTYARVDSPSTLTNGAVKETLFESEGITSEPWTFPARLEKSIADRISRVSVPLGQLPARIARGSSSGNDDIFILSQRGRRLITRQGQSVDVERGILRTPVYASDFGRYRFEPSSAEFIIFPYDVSASAYMLKPEAVMKHDFPKAYGYLLERKRELQRRKQFKAWYGFSAPRNLEVHDSAHFFVPLLANEGSYCRLPETCRDFCLMASGGFSITISASCGLSPSYVLGLLNSKLLFWRLRSISNVFRGGWITCTKQYVETLPIRTIDFSRKPGKAAHDRMVNLVDSMLTLHKHLAAAKSEAQKEVIQRQIDATDAEIDRLVYDLYGLTDEEIAIVEGKDQ